MLSEAGDGDSKSTMYPDTMAGTPCSLAEGLQTDIEESQTGHALVHQIYSSTVCLCISHMGIKGMSKAFPHLLCKSVLLLEYRINQRVFRFLGSILTIVIESAVYVHQHTLRTRVLSTDDRRLKARRFILGNNSLAYGSR